MLQDRDTDTANGTVPPVAARAGYADADAANCICETSESNGQIYATSRVVFLTRTARGTLRRDLHAPHLRFLLQTPPRVSRPTLLDATILVALARAVGANATTGSPCPPGSRNLARLAVVLLLVALPRFATATGFPRVVSRVYIDPDAGDVTAVATLTLPSSGTTVAALGTAAVPGRVHFLVKQEDDDATCVNKLLDDDRGGSLSEWRHDGGFQLPTGVGAVRSAAAIQGTLGTTTTPSGRNYFVFGTDQSPGVVVPGGDLKGGPVVLNDGEDVLATVVGVPHATNPSFVFATWTSPSRLVKIEISLATNTLRRGVSVTLPSGVNRVRTGVVDPRTFFDESISASINSPSYKVAHFVSDTSPSALVTVRVTDLKVIDALVFPLNENGRNVRTGCVVATAAQSGKTEENLETKRVAVSYWVTRGSSFSSLFRVTHDRSDGGGSRLTGRFDFETGEQLVTSVAVEVIGETAVVFVTFDEKQGDGQKVRPWVFHRIPPTVLPKLVTVCPYIAQYTADTFLLPSKVVVLLEQRDYADNAFAWFTRKAEATIPKAKSFSLLTVRNGLAHYATRNTPSELITVDYLGYRGSSHRLGVVDGRDDSGEVFSLSGPSVADPDATADDAWGDANTLCVVYMNQTHFGTAFLWVGDDIGVLGDGDNTGDTNTWANSAERKQTVRDLVEKNSKPGYSLWDARPC